MYKYSLFQRITAFIAFVFISMAAFAASHPVFDDWFDGRTLRLDYVFGGNGDSSAIYFEEACVHDGWAGRRHNLDFPWVRGNGNIVMTDKATGDTIYVNSFSTLFQEWQHTDEAARVARAFEHTILVPFPKQDVDVAVSLFDNRGNTLASMSHPINPKDIHIRPLHETESESRYVHRGGNPEECVDIVILAEGYTVEETEKFFEDAKRGAEALFSHEPFTSMKDRFNVLAVCSVSADSGPAVPREGTWSRTAHRSHYDTFYVDRYLTTRSMHGIYDALAGLPVEHIILMVNTPRYGGGGILNQVTVCTSDHPTFKQVLVHEFGHAYAGLADEYFYGDDSDTTYPTDCEPWEPNITALVDFDSKWADLVPKGTKIPTPLRDVKPLKDMDPSNKKDAKTLKELTTKVGAFEGAGYKAHGLYRPVQECRMKVNEVEYFCPVCSRAIVEMTDWHTRPVR